MKEEVKIQDQETGELILGVKVLNEEHTYPFEFAFEKGEVWLASTEAYEVYLFLEGWFGPKSIENE